MDMIVPILKMRNTKLMTDSEADSELTVAGGATACGLHMDKLRGGPTAAPGPSHQQRFTEG